MNTPRILIIDDDEQLAALLRELFASRDFEVDCAYTGERGYVRATQESWDIVILDVMLPGIDGFDVLRTIRAKSEVPVIMLTAKGEDSDRIAGFEGGADDYLAKPFNPRELLLRIFRR